MTRPIDAVKAALQAYVDKDRAAMEALVAGDYRFTSSLDNGLNRDAYFEICWPNSDMLTGFDIVSSAETGDTAFVVYEGRTTAGKRMRNCEVHRVRDGQLIATEVYFGWNLPHPVAAGAHQDDGGAG